MSFTEEPKFPSTSEGHLFTQSNGQKSFYYLDSFTDPWAPSEVILIQHGFARNAEFWYHWVPYLSRHYTVIRRDLRGHGRSSFPPLDNCAYAGEGEVKSPETYPYTVETIVQEIVELLDELKVAKVHFLGESTSGMVGQAFAAMYPERLRSLIVCSSPTHLPPAALDLFAVGHTTWWDAILELGTRGWAEALSKLPGTVANDDPRYLEWWKDEVGRSPKEGMAGYAKFLATLDSRPYLKKIECPTLILAPMRSAAVTVEAMEKVREEIKGAKMVVIDAPGHEIFTSGAEECVKNVLAFLQALKK